MFGLFYFFQFVMFCVMSFWTLIWFYSFLKHSLQILNQSTNVFFDFRMHFFMNL